MHATTDTKNCFTADWLITFGASGAPHKRRCPTAPWTTALETPAWTLHTQSPTQDWKGFPLATITAPDWRLWLFGELLGLPANTAPTDLALAVARGEKSARSLNGNFLLMGWHAATRQWHAWTDRFGTLHFYHTHDGHRAALGKFSPAAAEVASRRQLDWAGLTGFFTFGFFPEDRTQFEDVRILQPASHYVFDEHGARCSQERYWQWHHAPDTSRSYDDTVSEFARIFGEVMADHLRTGRIAVPISGGLDSRTTVAAMRGNHEDRLWAYSYGYSGDSVETRIAQQVAACRALPFQKFTVGPYLFDHLDRVIDSVEGFQDVTQSRQAAVSSETARHADYLIAAHWGDVVLGDMGLSGQTAPMDEAAILEHTFKKLAKRGRSWLQENLCAGRPGLGNPDQLARQTVTEHMAGLREIADADFRVKAYKTDTWCFRWTSASLRMFQPAAFPRLPFYDTRLTDFFCTVPTNFVAGRRLQIDYLKRFAPDLARVKWQVYDANLFHYQHFNSWLLPKRAVKKGWRLLTGQKITERNWEVQFQSDAGRAGLKHHLLRPGLRLHDLVAREKVESLLAAFNAAPLEDGRGYTVSMLLTFSAWLEKHG